MAGLFQLAAQIGEIVDFAIEDDGIALVFAAHGLRPAGDVDDGETGVAEGRRSAEGNPLAVRAAVMQRLGHALDGFALGGLSAVVINKRDTTHESGS